VLESDGGLDTCLSPKRIGGMVLIGVAEEARSLGTLTRFGRTGARPASVVAGTADSAPGTARFTCRAGGALAVASTPWGRLKRAQQLAEHRRQPGW
jgi:hypothetical protein